MNAREAWSATLGQLQVQLNRATYNTWLGRAEYVGYEDGRLIISVPHAYARDWLERNLAPSMTETFSRMLQSPSEIQIIVWDLAQTQPDVREVFGLVDDEPVADADGVFNLAQTFESFVVTPANSDAVLFAQFVLDSPFGTHSSLYISGAAGVGKTHLIQAMANDLLQRKLRIVFVSAEQFTAELVAALRHQEDMTPFRDKYRGCDVLIMDQVEFLEGKDRSEQELRFTCETLARRKRLMIFAGRRLPRDLHVHADLRACLNRWMVSTINPPDINTCAAILSRKAAALDLTLPDEARDALLTCINFDLSMIEGALAQVGHYARLTGRALTATLVYSLLRGRIGTPSVARAIDLPDVLTATAEQYGLTLADLTGKNRSKAVTQARHLAMHLARTLTDASLPQIGLALGGRDHSTVLHGCSRAGEALAYDTELRAAAAAITDRLRPKSPMMQPIGTLEPLQRPDEID